MHRLRAFVISAFLLSAAAISGCGSNPPAPAEKSYAVKGKVVAVDRDKKQVTLDHEDIPGLMKAMKMPFAVESEQLLDGIHQGDDVHGRLKVAAGKYVITELKTQ